MQERYAKLMATNKADLVRSEKRLEELYDQCLADFGLTRADVDELVSIREAQKEADVSLGVQRLLRSF